MGTQGKEGLKIGRAAVWRLRFGGWLTGVADLLLRTEPLWVMPALGFTLATLLWGISHSWAGLVITAIPFPLRRWRMGYFSQHTPFEIPVALFLVASFIGLAVSPDRDLSLRAFQSCIAGILLYYSLVNIPSQAYIKWGFVFAGVCVLTAILLAFGQGFTPPSALDGLGNWVRDILDHLPEVPQLSQLATPTMSTVHGLTIGAGIILLPLAGLFLFSRRMATRVLAIVLILPMLLLLLLFGSQGAWLAMGAGLVIVLVWRSRWAVMGISVVLGLGYMSYALDWLDPDSLFYSFNPGASLEQRAELWRAAMGVIRDHPVAGCGLGCLGRYATTYISPHNAYLQFYADFGLAGALALFMALVVAVRMALELIVTPRDHAWYGFAAGLVAAAGAVMVHGLFEVAPAGIIAETGGGGYFYIVSPAFAVLAGLFVRSQREVVQPPVSPTLGGLEEKET